VSSLATVGGALGAGLENDDAVRQAAYANRPDTTPRDLDDVGGGTRSRP
jgi:hypothetical protein